MLDLVFKNYTSSKSLKGKFFESILSAGIKTLKLPVKQIEVGLNLVGESRIRALNKKYRNRDKATDVLSFPLQEARLEKYGIMPLGDIFICLPFAKKETKRQNISIEKELAQLTVHGFLHLLGYNHGRSIRNAKKMTAFENKILRRVKGLNTKS